MAQMGVIEDEENERAVAGRLADMGLAAAESQDKKKMVQEVDGHLPTESPWEMVVAAEPWACSVCSSGRSI